MSDKKKNKKKEEKASPLKPEDEQARSIEYYQLRHREQSEKTDALYSQLIRKLKCQTLSKENASLNAALINFNQDKRDIVEYLTIKVNENEKAINSWEAKYNLLIEEKRMSEAKLQNENESYKKQLNSDVDNLQLQCIKYKSKLDELEHFAINKQEIEKQVSDYKALLEKKEVEYRETVHGLERKVLQDKNRMKREMLQKLNEAVANFRKVADQQMAETTKRAIRENLTITAQLNRMSVKVTELIGENNLLSQKITRLKTNNGLLVESEKELVKRNYANQKLVKTLIDKLQAFNEKLQILRERDANEGCQIILTDEMKAELEALQYDFNIVAARLGEVSALTNKIDAILGEVPRSGFEDPNFVTEVMDYVRTNVGIVVERLKSLTSFETDLTSSTGTTSERSVSVQETAPDIQSSENILNEVEEEDDGDYGEEQTSNSDYQEEFQPSNQSESMSLVSEPHVTERIQISELESQKGEQQPDAQFQGNPQASKHHLKLTKYEQRVTRNFERLLEEITVNTKSITEDERTVGTQTAPLQFAPPVSSKFLLGEVRPWGKPAEFLPRKGVGMYKSSTKKVPTTQILPTIQ